MQTRILQIYNRYRERGGEDGSVDRIFQTLKDSDEVDIERLEFRSDVYDQPDAPGRWAQARRMIYNPESLDRLEKSEAEGRFDVWMAHNVLPVGSMGIYRSAGQWGKPLMQYLHNLRPWCATGSVWHGGKIHRSILRGNPLPELIHARWQGSRFKNFWRVCVNQFAWKAGWLANITLWISVSNFMRDQLVSAGLCEKRIVTLRHSWNLIHATAPQPDPGEGRRPYYLYIGRVSALKGIGVLLEVARRMGTDPGLRHLEIRIAGSGDMEGEVRKAAGKLPNVKFLGTVHGQQKEDLLRNCEGLVIPVLWWEPLATVVHEGMEYGKPVLGPSHGGFVDVIRHQETGLLHPPGDVGEIVRQMRWLEESADRKHKIGLQGREWLERNTHSELWLKRFGQIQEYAIRLNKEGFDQVEPTFSLRQDAIW